VLFFRSVELLGKLAIAISPAGRPCEYTADVFEKKIASDYPRSLLPGLWAWWFAILYALPIAPTLAVAFLAARRRFAVALLGFPPRPLACLFPAARPAIPLLAMPWTILLLAVFEQTAPLRG
jgi:hypothetical protein